MSISYREGARRLGFRKEYAGQLDSRTVRYLCAFCLFICLRVCFGKAAGNVDAFGLTFSVELCLFSRTWKANGDVKIQGVVQAEAEQTSLCRTYRKRI